MDDRNYDEIVSEQNEKLRIQRIIIEDSMSMISAFLMQRSTMRALKIGVRLQNQEIRANVMLRKIQR